MKSAFAEAEFSAASPNAYRRDYPRHGLMTGSGHAIKAAAAIPDLLVPKNHKWPKVDA